MPEKMIQIHIYKLFWLDLIYFKHTILQEIDAAMCITLYISKQES